MTQDQAIETIKGKHHIGRIFTDYDPQSPREWDNLGTMVCWHRRYNLGDDQPRIAPDEWLRENAEKIAFKLSIYLYDHSGLALSSTSFFGRAQHAEFDSGWIGFIYITREKLLKEYSAKQITESILDKAKKVLESEINAYNEYTSGEVLRVHDHR